MGASKKVAISIVALVCLLEVVLAQTPCDSLTWLNTCHNFYRLPRIEKRFVTPPGNFPNPSFPQVGFKIRVPCDREITFQTCSRFSTAANALSLYDECPLSSPNVRPMRFSDTAGGVACVYGQDRATIARVPLVKGRTYYLFVRAQRAADIGRSFELLMHDFNCHQCGNPVADYKCPTATPDAGPTPLVEADLPGTEGLTMLQISLGDIVLSGDEVITTGFEVPTTVQTYKTFLYYRAMLPELSRPGPQFRYNVDPYFGDNVNFYFGRALNHYAINAFDLVPVPVALRTGDSVTVQFYLNRARGSGIFREVRLRIYYDAGGPPPPPRPTPLARTPVRTSLPPPGPTPLARTPARTSSPLPRPSTSSPPAIPSRTAIGPIRTTPVIRPSSTLMLGAPTPTRAQTLLPGRTSPRVTTPPRATSPLVVSRCFQAREFDTVELTCPPGMRISAITYGDWGRPSGICPGPISNVYCSVDIKNFLTRACVGRLSCEFIATNQGFGVDSCAGLSKTFSASWTCSSALVPTPAATPVRPIYTVTVSVREAADRPPPFVLSCSNLRPSDTIVRIISASYGIPNGTQRCLSPPATVMSNIGGRCLTYHSCAFRLYRRALGLLFDPCPAGVLPILSVVALCSRGPDVRTSSGGAFAIEAPFGSGSSMSSTSMGLLAVAGVLGVVAVALVALLASNIVKKRKALAATSAAAGTDDKSEPINSDAAVMSSPSAGPTMTSPDSEEPAAKRPVTASSSGGHWEQLPVIDMDERSGAVVDDDNKTKAEGSVTHRPARHPVVQTVLSESHHISRVNSDSWIGLPDHRKEAWT